MDGVLVVDKPQGMTSHDVVDFLRRHFGLKKVGHAGTLDPMATGVLVTLIGKCTKLSSLFISDDKVYEATMVLGARSDTGDAWGRITPCGESADFTQQEIEKVFKEFLGQTEQRPPMYSSVRFNGRKLYELARRGITVKVSPRRIFIKELEILESSMPQVSFRLTCSKGTYVRQLCADIGERLGCGAFLSKLNRIRSGRFTIGDALDIGYLKSLTKLDLEKRLHSV